jgi:hypothetical protein
MTRILRGSAPETPAPTLCLLTRLVGTGGEPV